VNLFGIHRVCEAFIPLLDSAAGRIVNITSASGPSFVATCNQQDQQLLTDPAISWSALQAWIRDHLNGSGETGNAYGFSKACANSYTMILARENPTLQINACTPGWIETDLTRPQAEGSGKSAAEMGMKPPAEGTRSALFLLFGEPQASGQYYGSDAIRSPLDAYRAPGDPPYSGD
jgi:NAD(P)-dependent dehydrogenase (short-subunit alcohol dehydrogenase family)